MLHNGPIPEARQAGACWRFSLTALSFKAYELALELIQPWVRFEQPTSGDIYDYHDIVRRHMPCWV